MKAKCISQLHTSKRVVEIKKHEEGYYNFKRKTIMDTSYGSIRGVLYATGFGFITD